MRDFARTLPARPLEDQVMRFDLMNRIDELQKQNLELKEEVARLNRGATDSGGDSGAMMIPVPESAPPRRSPTVPCSIRRPPVPPRQTDQPAERPAAPSPSLARHQPPPRVAQGETLSKIAQRYYGSRPNGTSFSTPTRVCAEERNQCGWDDIEDSIPTQNDQSKGPA